ncbi:unnamed protein product [Gongylonema pulchrum]|uniref:Hemerythrin domain-containing protein n=1 Tax=Gongylonema pulchrum TaxID=637853 RepID=A0A183DS19_9BILA|nr:unnamed protein product [Gongylonema pulchrum]
MGCFRKKKTLKEGGEYEDAALLNALKDLVSLIDTHQDELHSLLPALVAVDAVAEARTLQSRFLQLMDDTMKAIEAAWPPYICPYLIIGPLREIV